MLKDPPWIREAEREGAIYDEDFADVEELLELCKLLKLIEED